MDLWEFNCCVNAYCEIQKENSEERVSSAWMTANFVGAMLNGKLRKLSSYLKDSDNLSAPSISRDEFEQQLSKAKKKEV